jgi:hypothetical protein
LNDAEVMQNQKYCMAAKGDKKKLMEVMESFRTQCYTNFAVIIDFDCPPRPGNYNKSYYGVKSIC